MNHTDAIEFIAANLKQKYKNVYIEWTCEKTGLRPDIAIRLEKYPQWIYIEVGSTTAEKVKFYEDSAIVRELWWFDYKSLELVGKWKFGNGDHVRYSGAWYEENELFTKLRSIHEISLSKLESLKYEIRELEKETIFYQYLTDDKLRILCPSCLEPTSLKHALPDRDYHWRIMICDDCKRIKGMKIDDFPYIDTKTNRHFVVKLWEYFKKQMDKHSINSISTWELYELFDNAFKIYQKSISKIIK